MEQLHDKLKIWIDNPERDYSEGISLLTHVTRNRRLIQTLSKSESRYKREKLLYELKKHYKPIPSITTPTHIGESDTDQGQSAQNDIDTSLPPVDPAGGEANLPCDGSGEPLPPAGNTLNISEPTIPPPIASEQDNIVHEHLQISYSKMFNKKGMLVNQLRDFAEGDNEGRKKLMEQIADISKGMQAIDDKIKYFTLHGIMPAPDPEPPAGDSIPETIIPDDPILMKQMLLNERSNVSKLKRKIQEGNANPDRIAEMETNLQKKTDLVNEIVRRLDGNGS